MKKDHRQKRSRKSKRGHTPAQPFRSPGFHPSTAQTQEPGSLISKVRQFNLEFFGVRCASSLLTEEEKRRSAASAAGLRVPFKPESNPAAEEASQPGRTVQTISNWIASAEDALEGLAQKLDRK